MIQIISASNLSNVCLELDFGCVAHDIAGRSANTGRTTNGFFRMHGSSCLDAKITSWRVICNGPEEVQIRVVLNVNEFQVVCKNGSKLPSASSLDRFSGF